MKKYKFLIPYIFCLIGIGFALLIWDDLKLPYDPSNIIQGTAYNKQLNPYNNIIKVIFFIFFPLILFLFSFVYFKKNLLSLNPSNKHFFLSERKLFNKNKIDSKFNHYNNNLNYFTCLIFFLLVLEFLSLNFNFLLSPIDIYHDGLVLSPSINYQNYGALWSSIHFDYGVGGNLRPIFIWKLIGKNSIGSIRFLDTFIILIIKIILLALSRKISIIIFKNNNFFILFFLIFTLSVLELTEYFESLTGTGGAEFPLRVSLFLLFLYFLIENITLNESSYKNILLGLFSSISFLWFTDISIYINGLLLIYLLYLIILKKNKKFNLIAFGIFLSWIFFVFNFSSKELLEMFSQINANLKFIYYFNFLEYPKPFSDHFDSARGAKSLILIILNAVLCINVCLDKKYQIDYKTKLLIIFLFISSLIIFKGALIRSDQYHLKYTSGLIFFLFLLQIYLLIFIYFKKKITLKIININKSYINIILSLAIIVFFTMYKNINLNDIYKNIKFEIKSVLLKDDLFFLNFKPGMYSYGKNYDENDYQDDKKFINYYRQLTEGDKCIQNFTEYLAISYFLNKSTCTSFYNAQFIQHGITDKKFLVEFKNNLPNFIIYTSPIVHIGKDGNLQQKNLLIGIPKVDDFIKKNYLFYENYLNKWVILKKK